MKQSLTTAWVLITDVSRETSRRADPARIVRRPESDAARIAALEPPRPASSIGSFAETLGPAETLGTEDRRIDRGVESAALPTGG